MSEQWTSFALLAASGLVQASFALPVKYFRGWRWEQMWVAQAVTANLLLPFLWAALQPRSFWTLAAETPWTSWLALYLWGIGWGLGGVAYGLTLTRLGISFVYSFVFGTTTLAGAVLPLLFGSVRTPSFPAMFAGGLTLALLATAAAGVVRWKTGSSRPAVSMAMPVRLHSYASALQVAILAGVFSASYGLAFSFEYSLVEALAGAGVSAASAPLIVALPLYIGSASVAIPFGLVCAARSRTVSFFWTVKPGRHWMLALMMGICGVGGVFLYGVGISGQGHPSPNVAFGIYMSFFVLGGNTLGVVTGEIKGSTPAMKITLWMSILGFIVAAWLLKLS